MCATHARRRLAALELHEEAQWRKTDVISRLHSCQHVCANNGRYAGLRSSACLECALDFTVSTTSPGIMWWSQRLSKESQRQSGGSRGQSETQFPRLLNRQGLCYLNHIKSFTMVYHQCAGPPLKFKEGKYLIALQKSSNTTGGQKEGKKKSLSSWYEAWLVSFSGKYPI